MTATYVENLKVSIVIDNLANLEVITKDFFNPVERSLQSLVVENCPKLYSIEQRSDYPHYPLPHLKAIHLRNLNDLERLDFLNSQFENRHSRFIEAHDNILIEIMNNPKLKTILLDRPLGFKGKNNVDLRIDTGAQLSPKGILNVCFLKNKVK